MEELKGGQGEGEAAPPPPSPPAGERKGAGGKGRAARRALPAPALQPVQLFVHALRQQ
jgi:hypothetical protein